MILSHNNKLGRIYIMNKDFNINHDLLIRLLQRTKDVNFETSNYQQCITVSFYARLVSSSNAILLLIDDAYNACILVSHMIEALIQLIWMQEQEDRIKQYIDFGVVEQLDSLNIYPENREKIIKYIKEHRVQRLLKKEFLDKSITDKIILNAKNYHKFWYNPDANSIKTIADKLIKNENHGEADNLYHMYKRFCSYKHCSPYVMLPRNSTKFKPEVPDAFLAITVAFQCLYICCLLVNKYQSAPVNLDDITEEYESVLEIKHS